MTRLARRRRERFEDRRPRWFDVPEEVDPDDDDGSEYDRFGMMMKIDEMGRDWRDLINEYGFSWAMKAKADGLDPKSAAQALARMRALRQGV